MSYAREDAAFVDNVVRDLRQAGVDVWRDVEQLKPGDRWRDALEDALEASRALRSPSLGRAALLGVREVPQFLTSRVSGSRVGSRAKQRVPRSVVARAKAQRLGSKGRVKRLPSDRASRCYSAARQR